ncbi:MAG TPA: glycoside hydrolase family 43 protein [Chryseolinea sp.]|nr:glycoside hydrolase family 43 protein [Chryseolinea sp.]
MRNLLLFITSLLFFCSCERKTVQQPVATDTTELAAPSTYLSTGKPLVTEIFTADPSAHVFDDRIYVYPSHDIDAGTPENDMGDHFDMNDYHVLSMDSIGGPVTDHGVALDIKNIPWAGRQLWAPDAAFSNGKYFLYFPAKDKADVFRIGVATAASPAGPFTAEAQFIPNSYSIDPAVFRDDDGKFYLYFGGIWGGQLQRWSSGRYNANGSKTDAQKDDAPAIGPRAATLSSDMLKFEGKSKEVQIINEDGKPILAKDHDRRFFEASWMHKYNGKYYFSYSTGDTHFICYAVGESPLGPFKYKGVILNPVVGWTNHHSIIEVKGKWYLFYHDSQLSGKTHLRNVKVTTLEHLPDGTIRTIDAPKI